MMSRWLSAVRRMLLLLLLLKVSVEAVESDKAPRTKRQTTSTCEAKYREFSAQHTLCLEDKPDATLVPLSPEKKDEIVQIHNNIRANVDPPAANMMRMRWDERLARTAEKWVMQCITDHDDMRNRQEPDWPLVKIGQNLGMGHRSFAAMIERFYTEQFRYNYTYGGGYVHSAGHHFQLVSYEATLIGCAESRCPSSRFKVFRVCNYAPALNSIKPPYKNGTWCGDCPNNCDSSGKLCDCGGKLCYNAGHIDPATCQCKCQLGKTGENCEFVDCTVGDLLNACKFGAYTRDDCGKPGTFIRDPSLCPQLCGLCDHICGGKQCDSGLTLDKKTCTCKCIGPHCGAVCGGKQCGWGHVVDPETCECKCVGSHCTPCGNRECKNFHRLNLNTCTCYCQGGFTGPMCEFCPASDSPECPRSPKLCAVHAFTCPYLCGLCPSSEPQPTPGVTTVTNKGVTDKGVTYEGVTGGGVTDKGVTDKGVTDKDGEGEEEGEGGTAAHVHARKHTHIILVALLIVLSRVTAQHFC